MRVDGRDHAGEVFRLSPDRERLVGATAKLLAWQRRRAGSAQIVAVLRRVIGARLATVSPMDADAARTKLLSQHEGIRTQLDRCTILAHQLLAGAQVVLELDAALSILRTEFVEHNVTETALVGEFLRGLVDRGPLLIERMLQEHLAEHSEFFDRLAGPACEMAARIDDLVEELEAHMAAEERTFLNPLVLRSNPRVASRL